ncbi:hypothetical protein SAMN05444392_102489 [Seinonella peptonophila]|uniref:Phosphate transport regulator n=1 Tax=Seinonella peptonophila TaxID=112248 RepID=A0A1M4VQZ0_9BACL|nr:DUF47 family protein [Seinonella peptonophila]SHE71474.1 hypothetical protein SAMN05444392_102489 [Seinonella peptonophila]
MFFNRSKDQVFYQILIDATANIVEAVELFRQNVETLTEREKYAEKLKELESKGDEYTHLLITELNRTFVTPLDREDILELGVKLDDVVDGIESCTGRFISLHVEKPTTYLAKFADILVRSAEQLQLAFVALEKKDYEGVRRANIAINSLENDSDNLLLECISELFENPTDLLHLIKMKEIYERLEDVIDTFEDVMDVMESVAMKYA